MSEAWDHHKTLSEWAAWVNRQAKEAHDDLRRKLVSELPEELIAAACDLMDVLDGTVSDEWPDLTRQVLMDAGPPEDDPGYCEQPRREHGTYDATSIYGRVA